MTDKLKFILGEIALSYDIKERRLLRGTLSRELNKIEKIANKMPDEQAKVFLRGLSFEINKAQFFYGAGTNFYSNKKYVHE